MCAYEHRIASIFASIHLKHIDYLCEYFLYKIGLEMLTGKKHLSLILLCEISIFLLVGCGERNDVAVASNTPVRSSSLWSSSNITIASAINKPNLSSNSIYMTSTLGGVVVGRLGLILLEGKETFV